jgi:hypothetical protein
MTLRHHNQQSSQQLPMADALCCVVKSVKITGNTRDFADCLASVEEGSQ